MLARLSAFVIWALVAATAVFWGLRLWARSIDAPAYTVPVADATVGRGDLGRLLGTTPAAAAAVVAAPEAAARFKLLGIMAPKPAAGPSQQGVALIAVDGKPPRAFVVGSALDSGMVLQSVSLRTASIGPAEGKAAVLLELPPLQAAATGTLPPPGAGAAPRNPAAVAPPPPAPPLPMAPTTPPVTRPVPPSNPPQGMLAPPPMLTPVPPATGASIPRDPAAPPATLTQ